METITVFYEEVGHERHYFNPNYIYMFEQQIQPLFTIKYVI